MRMAVGDVSSKTKLELVTNSESRNVVTLYLKQAQELRGCFSHFFFSFALSFLTHKTCRSGGQMTDSSGDLVQAKMLGFIFFLKTSLSDTKIIIYLVGFKLTQRLWDYFIWRLKYLRSLFCPFCQVVSLKPK